MAGSADLGGVFEAPVTNSGLERKEFGFGLSDQLCGAQRVTLVTGVGLNNDSAGAVFEGDLGGLTAGLSNLHPHRVIAVGCGEGFGAGDVAVQAGGEDVVEPG